MTTATCSPAYVISRSRTDDAYLMWRFDPGSPELLTPVPHVSGTFNRTHSLIAIGGYFLSWGPMQKALGSPFYDYRLVPFDPSASDPLAALPLQHGQWSKSKFWGRLADFGNPDGAHRHFDGDSQLVLIPLGTFLLNFIADEGRGTFGLWSFDPCSVAPGTTDPIPSPYPYTAQGAFRDIQKGHELLAFDNYVLDRVRATGEYRVFSFDPQAIIPLPHPPVQRGVWQDIDDGHELVPIGDYVLDWVPSTRTYRLWKFDPRAANPLTGPLQTGRLPDVFCADSLLTAFQPTIPVDEERAKQPGTIDFMRKKIKHVVYYMLENRSFDHVCGWLHDKDANIRVVGPTGKYDGASTDMYNMDGDTKVFLSKYKDGKLSTAYMLEMFDYDPYHDMSDVLRQMYSAQTSGSAEREVPDMGGFVLNNSSRQVMQTYSPEQLPVLNGIAAEYAISDAWFCSMPGATDVNRSFAVTGSAQQQINNFMSPPQYFYWPEQPHRASIWKTLWANGMTDWKIYNSTQWMNQVFTYELFLKGQIPTVDADVAAARQNFIAPIDQFYADALSGNLPAFSYLEPIWIGETGTSSYHPGEDLVPGEVQLNKIYDSLRKGPNWDETLLIVTFDEHGGIFDHVPPPRAVNPWPNDVVDGFRFYVMGVRVPTIVASPWVEKNTVFRSLSKVAYDGTSFMATLLQWFGVPRERWFLGDRLASAPSFESVLTRDQPRSDSPSFKPPYDKQYPPEGPPSRTTKLHDLHRHVAHVLIASMVRGKLSPAEAAQLSHEVATEVQDIDALTRRLVQLSARFR